MRRRTSLRSTRLGFFFRSPLGTPRGRDGFLYRARSSRARYKNPSLFEGLNG